MTWELYEVWAVDTAGHEELIDTTKSLKEAREIAANEESAVIYREDAEGNLIEIERRGP